MADDKLDDKLDAALAKADALVRRVDAVQARRADASGPSVRITGSGKSRNVVIEMGGQKQTLLRSVDPSWDEEKIKSYINQQWGAKFKLTGATWA